MLFTSMKKSSRLMDSCMDSCMPSTWACHFKSVYLLSDVGEKRLFMVMRRYLDRGHACIE